MAEAVVGRAWAEELVRRRGELDLAVGVAYEECDQAYRRLVAASRGRDPGQVDRARAALARSVAAGRACAAERDRAELLLRVQLEVLRRTTGDRLRAAAIRGRSPDPCTTNPARPQPPAPLDARATGSAHHQPLGQPDAPEPSVVADPVHLPEPRAVTRTNSALDRRPHWPTAWRRWLSRSADLGTRPTRRDGEPRG